MRSVEFPVSVTIALDQDSIRLELPLWPVLSCQVGCQSRLRSYSYLLSMGRTKAVEELAVVS